MDEKNQVFEVVLKDLEQEKKILEETLEVKDHKLREIELQKLNVINDLETSNKRMQSSENRVKNLQADAEENHKKLEAVKQECLTAENQKKRQEEKLQEAESRTQFVEEEISRLSIALNKGAEKLRQLEFEEKRNSARYEAILRMEENNEGYYKGVREVLQANIPGVEGVFFSFNSNSRTFGAGDRSGRIGKFAGYCGRKQSSCEASHSTFAGTKSRKSFFSSFGYVERD